jgi:hypothetical protein
MLLHRRRQHHPRGRRRCRSRGQDGLVRHGLGGPRAPAARRDDQPSRCRGSGRRRKRRSVGLGRCRDRCRRRPTVDDDRRLGWLCRGRPTTRDQRPRQEEVSASNHGGLVYPRPLPLSPARGRARASGACLVRLSPPGPQAQVAGLNVLPKGAGNRGSSFLWLRCPSVSGLHRRAHVMEHHALIPGAIRKCRRTVAKLHRRCAARFAASPPAGPCTAE